MLLIMVGRKQQSFDKLRTLSYIIGIDEVGRGPLAGPVVVCAVAIPSTLRPISIAPKVPLRPSILRQAQHKAGSGSRASLLDNRLALRDSKKLTTLQRSAWTTAIKTNPRINYSVASVSSLVVDRINVTQAANRAATRALSNILSVLPPFKTPTTLRVYLDGGLHINAIAITNPHLILRVETIIKGDEKIPAISLASIIAKQHRDALMHRAHKKYPQYGFDRHVGYGTKKHILAIKENGLSPLHRKSFLKKIV